MKIEEAKTIVEEFSWPKRLRVVTRLHRENRSRILEVGVIQKNRWVTFAFEAHELRDLAVDAFKALFHGRRVLALRALRNAGLAFDAQC